MADTLFVNRIALMLCFFVKRITWHAFGFDASRACSCIIFTVQTDLNITYNGNRFTTHKRNASAVLFLLFLLLFQKVSYKSTSDHRRCEFIKRRQKADRTIYEFRFNCNDETNGIFRFIHILIHVINIFVAQIFEATLCAFALQCRSKRILRFNCHFLSVCTA